MLYRLFINYLRIQMFRYVLRYLKSRTGKSKKLNTMSILTYGLELLGLYALKRKKK